MILNWQKIAKKIYDDIKQEISKSEKKPSLWVVLVGKDDSPSLRYVKQKEKVARDIWFDFVLKHLDPSISEDKLINEIKDFNTDKNIDWFIVQLALPSHINTQKIINLINPKKDVDWFHPENQWKTVIWDNTGLKPCTPAGVIEMLKAYNINPEWKDISIIWASNIVGKPLANILINLWATVSVCHSKTKDIIKYTKNADILISATWAVWLIKNDMIKKDTVVIDVWFSVIDWKIYGDCDFENIEKAWNPITPVPGWVWPMTVAMLMQNTLKASKNNLWNF